MRSISYIPVSGEKEERGETKKPGAARFGNFINYYEFNPPEERLSRLPQVKKLTLHFIDTLYYSNIVCFKIISRSIAFIDNRAITFLGAPFI